MTTAINRSNFFYYLFRPGSSDLSTETQKKMKLATGLIGGFTFGVGLAICGIAYLIQSSCDKTAKTQAVAQPILHPINNLSPERPTPFIDEPTAVEELFPFFKERVKQCIKAFEGELPLSNLSAVQITWDSHPEIHCREFEINQEIRNKKDLLEFIEDKLNIGIFVTKSSTDGIATLTITMLGEDDNLETTVNTRVCFKDQKLVEVSGPGVSTINKSLTLPNNLFK
jgi:hypothetical protein